MPQEQAQSPSDLDPNHRSVALTVAGSDSGGGAGIQADLKTFSFYGVHGTSAITSVTAQNTEGVRDVHHMEPSFVARQMEAVLDDVSVHAVKTGMLATGPIIERVVSLLDENNLDHTVVDPVMVAQSGDSLLGEQAREVLVEKMLPFANVITPNIHEAEYIMDTSVGGVGEMQDVAAEMSDRFDAAIVLKGGHLEGQATDVLAYDGQVWTTESPRLDRNTTHGSGCAYSSAITANLAMNRSIAEAVQRAKNFITEAIRWGVNEGKGPGCVEPGWGKFRATAVQQLQEALSSALQELQHLNFAPFIPEVQSNFTYALENAHFPQDVVGFPGRIVRVEDDFRILEQPSPGGSDHMARLVLAAMKQDPAVRSALNIRYSREIAQAARRQNLLVYEHNRQMEPQETREEEGESMDFIVERAYEKNEGNIPDIIFDRGGIGKEAMVRILGENPSRVVETFRSISSALDE